MLVIQPASPASVALTNAMGLGGFVEDVANKIGAGVKAGAAILKDLTTIHSEHVIKVELPEAGAIVRRTLPALALSVVVIAGAIYGTKRLLGPAACPVR